VSNSNQAAVGVGKSRRNVSARNIPQVLRSAAYATLLKRRSSGQPCCDTGVVIGDEQEIAAVAAYYERIQSPLAAAERNCN
jgi:hypothetical protein